MGRRAIRTTGGIGAAGRPGPPGAAGAGTLAPNVTATASVFYAPYGNAYQFGFHGIITLPTSDPDYSHLDRIEVIAFDAGGNGVPLCTFLSWGGSTITYSGIVGLLDISQIWSVVFQVYNEGGAPSPSPYTVSGVAVQASGILSVSASKRSGSEFQDDVQGLHAYVDVVPVVVGGRFPQVVDIWLDKADGLGWQNQLWATLTTVGQVVSVDAFVPLDPAQTGWKVAAFAGTVDLSLGPPAGFVQNTFTFPAAAACIANGVSGAQFVPDGSGNTINYIQHSVGIWEWVFAAIQWTQPSLSADPNYWFSFITVQKGYTDGGGAWHPAPDREGVDEKPGLYNGRWITDSGHIQGLSSILGSTVTLVGDLDLSWTFPPELNPDGTPNLYREFRFWIYDASVRNRSNASPVSFVLQTTAWSGADHGTLIPVTQPAALDLTRTNPHTLGTGMGLDGSNRPSVQIAGPIYANISNALDIRVAPDFVVSSVGGFQTLGVGFVNLVKATGFGGVNPDGSSIFAGGGGAGPFTLDRLGVNFLAAGDALFAGTATFAYKNGSLEGGKVTINSSGMTFADKITSPNSTMTLASSGATIAKGTNNVQVTASGIVIFEGGVQALQIDAGGVTITKGASSVTVTASAVTITNGDITFETFEGTVSITPSSLGVECVNGANSAHYSSTSMALTFGTQNLTCIAGILSISAGSASASLSPFALLITNLPSINPGAGTKMFWHDPSDGNTVKFAA